MSSSPSPIDSALEESLRVIRERVEITPRVGVILGAEHGAFSDRLKNVVRVPLLSDANANANANTNDHVHVALGYIDDVPVACLEGRPNLSVHRASWRLVHGVRVVARLGAKAALVVESVGTLDPSWSVGNLALVTDHITLSGVTDWIGHLESPGFDPFPNMHPAYDPILHAEMHDVVRAENLLSARIASKALANQKPIELSEGIYANLPDPAHETPAQVRLLQTFGASFVGHRLIPEVIALKQHGVRVTALVASSYRAAGLDHPTLDETTSRSDLGPLYRLTRGWIVRAARMLD